MALAVADKLASSNPVLNFLAGEMALQLELLDAGDIIFEHMLGATNVTADLLSRVAAPGTSGLGYIDCLKGAKPVTPARLVRDKDFYRLPLPSAAPSFWHGQAEDL